MAIPSIDSFYLVGGTALALQIGHRASIDLDLFSLEIFDKSSLLDTLYPDFQVVVESEESSMLLTYLDDVKVDFVKMSYPILFPPLVIDGIRMLDLKDIAPMKLKAIAQRGSKKDFYDIHFLFEYIPLEQMLNLFKEKFKQHEIFHIIKSLTYFDDAEAFADPVLFNKKMNWEKIKTSIKTEVKKLITS